MPDQSHSPAFANLSNNPSSSSRPTNDNEQQLLIYLIEQPKAEHALKRPVEFRRCVRP